MFEVSNEIKAFVAKKQNLLKPLAILKIVDNVISDMLALGIPKKSILTHINDELNTDIKYSTFLKYVNKKGLRANKRPSTQKQTQTGADGFLAKLRGDTSATDSSPAEKSGVPKIVGII